jgi:hypothetical protein
MFKRLVIFIKENPAYLILVLLHCTFLMLALSFKNIHLKDSAEYIYQAQNIRNNFSWYAGNLSEPFDAALVSQRPPMYGILLAMTWFESLGDIPVLIIQIMISLMSCFMIFKIVNLLSDKKINSWLLLFPMMCFFSQFVYTNTIMSEMLFQLFIVSAIYYLLEFIKIKDQNSFWRHQLLLTLSFLTKPITWLFPLFTSMLILYLIIKRRIPQKALLTFIIPFFVILLMFVYNKNKTGVPEYSSIQRKLMINYNVPAVLNLHYDKTLTAQVMDSIQNFASTLSYPERARFIDNVSIDIIKKDISGAIYLQLKGALLFFLDSGSWDLNYFFNGSSGNKSLYFKAFLLLYKYFMVIINLLILISIFRFSFLKEINGSLRLIILSSIFYFAFLIGPSASARFKVPIYPLMVVACYFGVKSTVTKYKNSDIISS